MIATTSVQTASSATTAILYFPFPNLVLEFCEEQIFVIVYGVCVYVCVFVVNINP